MAKKASRKFNLNLTKPRKKQIISLSAVAVGAVAFSMVMIGANAAPGNPFYKVDRSWEAIVYKTKVDNYSKIDYELDLAYERLSELEETEKSVNHTEIVLNDYDKNLENILTLSNEIVQDEDFDESKFAILMNDILKVHNEAMQRKIVTKREVAKSLKADDVAKEINRSGFKLNTFNHDLFDVAIRNIENDEEFNNYAKLRLAVMVQDVAEKIEFAQQDFGSIKQYLNEEQSVVLTKLVNDSRNTFLEARDKVGVDSNLVVYEKLYASEQMLDGEFTDKLVEYSGGF